jgi:hypothetical protein
MKKEIKDKKNGLTYTLVGDYYLPDLYLEDVEPVYGKYGMLRKTFLREHRNTKYQILLLQGKLTEHLNQIDAEAKEKEEFLIMKMMDREGVNEELKRRDSMDWVRKMNAIRHTAEEIILEELIYTKN